MSKYVLSMVLALPLFGACTAAQQKKIEAAAEAPVPGPDGQPVLKQDGTPVTVGDTGIAVASDAAGLLTGNPVIGIAVGGILTALFQSWKNSKKGVTPPPTV